MKNHHVKLYQHAYWMTGNKELAAECVQECFYQAWLSRRSLREPAKAYPWLLTILRRTVFREIKSRQQLREAVDIDVAAETVSADEHDLVLLHDLTRALSMLPAQQCDLILLHALQGYDYEELSILLETPIGTVMSRLARARAALRDIIERTASQPAHKNVSLLLGAGKKQHE